MPRFCVSLPGPERPEREGRLPCASPELKTLPESWREPEATSAEAEYPEQLRSWAPLRRLLEAVTEHSQGVPTGQGCAAGSPSLSPPGRWGLWRWESVC